MYTNETVHYGIPKPLGTDLTVPQDYNEAADAIDQALFDASSNATEAVTAANNAVEAAAEAVEDVGDLGTEVNSLKGRTSALEATEIIQNNKIDNLENQGVTKFDSAGIADPYVNGLTYSVGNVVTYNGQRYKCTTAVVAAEPFDADKWTAEDVETVLNNLKSDLTKTSITILKTENSHLRNDVIVEKWGNVVNIALRGFQSITPKTVVTLFNLPEAYRPTVPKQYEFITVVDDERYTIQVTVAGNIEFYDYSNTANHVDSVNMTLSYII